jgi:regulator of CtrA degradation
LPERLRHLIEQSLKLQERVIRLDQMLDFNQPAPAGDIHHPLSTHLSRLREAFGPEAD